MRGKKNEHGATLVLITMLLVFLAVLGFGAASVGSLVTNGQQTRNAGNGLAMTAAWQCLANPIQDLPGLAIATAALSGQLAAPNFPPGTPMPIAKIDYWTVADEATNPTWAFADVTVTANVKWVLMHGLGLNNDPITRAVRAAVRQEKMEEADITLLPPLYVLVIDYSGGGQMPIDPCNNPPCPSMNRVVRDAVTGTQGILPGDALLENMVLRSRVEIGGVVHSNVVFNYNIGGPVTGRIPIEFENPDVITAFDNPLTHRGPLQTPVVCGDPPGCRGNMQLGLQEAKSLLDDRRAKGDMVFPELIKSYLLVYADGIPKLPGGDVPAQAAARAAMSDLLVDPKVVDAAIVIWLRRAGIGAANPETFMRSLASQDPQGYVDFPAGGIGQSVFVAAANVTALGAAFNSGNLDVKCFSVALGGGVAGNGPFPADPIFAYVRDVGNVEEKMGRVDVVEDLDATMVGGSLVPPFAFFYDEPTERLIFSSDVCNAVLDDGASIIVRYGRPRIMCRTIPAAGPNDC